jgi:hypothetical protein
VSSTTSTFHAYSLSSTDPSAIRVPSRALGARKSDLYTWREIFQLYIEAEVFESIAEASRGQRTVADSEARLQRFAERVALRGLGTGRKLKLEQSRRALETFLQLNVFILNVKKVCTLLLSLGVH